MDELSSDIYEGSKMVVNGVASNKKFYLKLFFIFCLYLLTYYLFDCTHKDDLTQVFADKPYTIIKIPNKIAFLITNFIYYSLK